MVLLRTSPFVLAGFLALACLVPFTEADPHANVLSDARPGHPRHPHDHLVPTTPDSPQNELKEEEKPGKKSVPPKHSLSTATNGLVRGVEVGKQALDVLGFRFGGGGGAEVSGNTLSLEDLQLAAISGLSGLAYHLKPGSEEQHERILLDVLRECGRKQIRFSVFSRYGLKLLAHAGETKYKSLQTNELLSALEKKKQASPFWFIARGMGEGSAPTTTSEPEPEAAVDDQEYKYHSLEQAIKSNQFFSELEEKAEEMNANPLMLGALPSGGVPIVVCYGNSRIPGKKLSPPSSDTLYVIFRGTQNIADWVSNLDIAAETFHDAAFSGGFGCKQEDGCGFFDPKADDKNDVIMHPTKPELLKIYKNEKLHYHRGFLRRALGAAKALRDQLENLAAEKTTIKRIVVAGHSLGAGQASVFGSLLVRGVLAKDVINSHGMDITKDIFVTGFSTPPTLIPGKEWQDNASDAYDRFLKQMVKKAGLHASNSKHFIIGSDIVPRIGAILFELLKFEQEIIYDWCVEQVEFLQSSKKPGFLPPPKIPAPGGEMCAPQQGLKLQDCRDGTYRHSTAGQYYVKKIRDQVVGSNFLKGINMDFLKGAGDKMFQLKHSIHPGGDYILLKPDVARPSQASDVVETLRGVLTVQKLYQKNPPFEEAFNEHGATILFKFLNKLYDWCHTSPVVVRLDHNWHDTKQEESIDIWGMHETLARLNHYDLKLWINDHLTEAFVAGFSSLIEVVNPSGTSRHDHVHV